MFNTRLHENTFEEEVPDKFWNRFYNISSGPSFRLTNYEFESKLLGGTIFARWKYQGTWLAIHLK